MITRIFKALQILVGASIALTASGGYADTYPTKPIRFIVPFPPGGTTDIVARAVYEKIGAHLGQPLVIDNRGAEGGVVGATLLARAASDGYTLGMATVSTIATAPAIRDVPYSPTEDFAPIVNIAATPNVLVVNPRKLPLSQYKDLMVEVNKRPAHYTYANAGTGSLGHALTELFQSETRTSMRAVPYRGGGPAMTAVVSGEVDLMIANLPTALPHVMANPKRLVALAVTAEERLPSIRDVPTFKELQLPGVNRLAFYGICGPRQVSKEVVSAIHAAVMKALADPRVRERIENTGSIIIGNTPAEFDGQIRAEHAIYKKVLAGLKGKL